MRSLSSRFIGWLEEGAFIFELPNLDGLPRYLANWIQAPKDPHN
jgi:hypothetical protein